MRDITVSIRDDVANKWQEVRLLEDSAKRGVWHAFCAGVYGGQALWYEDKLRWEPAPDNITGQPSDSMLAAMHLLIGESFPVAREVLAK